VKRNQPSFLGTGQDPPVRQITSFWQFIRVMPIKASHGLEGRSETDPSARITELKISWIDELAWQKVLFSAPSLPCACMFPSLSFELSDSAGKYHLFAPIFLSFVSIIRYLSSHSKLKLDRSPARAMLREYDRFCPSCRSLIGSEGSVSR
jgi:hypothetical protein